MIRQQEIQDFSNIYKIQKSQIDKDWVLSYLLLAITSMPELKDILVFKGGTCLKKCYFPDYRFSEDLDFTILDSSFVFDKAYLERILAKATELSFDELFNRGILFKLKEIEPTQSKDEDQGYKVYIYYWGADHRKNDMPADKANSWHHTIKLDINHTEEIIFPIAKKQLLHNFSDKEKFKESVLNCYSIPEMLAEKIRSLIQRKYTSPRDCYDIWYIKNTIEDLNWDEIKIAFFRKIAIKNIEFEGVDQLINSKKERILKQHWQTQLAIQFPINKLPDYDTVISELKLFFNNLFSL